MCGRFTVATAGPALTRARFGLDESADLRSRYNVAPSDDVLALRREGPAVLRWGYLRDRALATINARAETLRERPVWREALHDGRCLIVADGFYEWSAGPDGRRQAHWVTRADRAPFAFAGLASPWGTCAIVTTAATAALAGLHDRMPVILEPAAEARWLAGETAVDEACALLGGLEDTVAVPVGPAVNDARHDAPDCLDPPAPAPASLF